MKFRRTRAKPNRTATRSPRSGRTRDSDYEYYGETSIQRMVDAAFEEGWGAKILFVVWTSGPVTAVALLFAFWLINGRMPPVNLLIYFGIFTGLSSLLTVFTNFFLRVRQEKRKMDAQQALLWAVGGLTDFILAVRNEYLDSLDPQSGKNQSALYLLQDPDSTPDSIETAVEDLTRNREISQHFRRLESYRKKGLSTHVRDESAYIQEHFQPILNSIAEGAPEASHYLALRMEGKIPSKKLGKIRKKHFLKNIGEALDIDNPDKIDLRDTEELLKLTLELLTGRSYFIVKWKAFGSHPLAVAVRRREQPARDLLRLKKRRSDLVGILSASLKNTGFYPDLKLETEKHFEKANLPLLIEAIDQLPAKIAAEKTRSGQQALSKKEIAELEKVMRELIETSQSFEAASRKLQKARDAFWSLRREYGPVFPLEFFKKRPSHGSGVYFHHFKVRLTEAEKIELARNIKVIFQNFSAEADLSLLGDRDREYELDNLLSTPEIKRLTLEIYDVLLEFVDLSVPSVREAIEASNSFYMGLIETGLSRRAKYGWISAMAEEIEERPNLVTLRTIERLLTTFKAGLSPQAIQFLCDVHKIPRKQLEAIGPSGTKAGQPTDPDVTPKK